MLKSLDNLPSRNGSDRLPERRMLRIAYMVADDLQENVYLVTAPRNKIESQENLGYVVLESLATDWDKTNGMLIHWRQR